MSKSQVTIKRAHVFLGGPYHGAVKMVRVDEMAYLLPRRELPRVAYDDVRKATAGGDVFVYSELAPETAE